MKMHVLSGGRVRMRKSIYVPDADRSETIELPVSLLPAAPPAGQRAVRHRLPSVGRRECRGALGRHGQVHDADHAAGRERAHRPRRHRPRARRHRRRGVLAPASRPLRLQRLLQARDRHACTRRRSRRRARRTPSRWAISRPSGIIGMPIDAIERRARPVRRRPDRADPAARPHARQHRRAGRSSSASGTFLLAADTVSLRATLDQRRRAAQHLERRRAGEIARRDQAHRGARRHRALRPRRRAMGHAAQGRRRSMTDARRHRRGRRSSARASSAPRTRACSPGAAAIVDDRQVARVLHVAFRRSEHAHARIVSIDCAAARAAPGVVAVLTARGPRRGRQAAARDLAHEAATTRRRSCRSRATRCAMSASRSSAWWRRAATSPRTRSS